MLLILPPLRTTRHTLRVICHADAVIDIRYDAICALLSRLPPCCLPLMLMPCFAASALRHDVVRCLRFDYCRSLCLRRRHLFRAADIIILITFAIILLLFTDDFSPAIVTRICFSRCHCLLMLPPLLLLSYAA